MIPLIYNYTTGRPAYVDIVTAIFCTRMTMREPVNDNGGHMTEAQCNTLWHRIQAKKYVYGFGRGEKFINRCRRIQKRVDDIITLRQFAAEGIDVTDPLEGHVIWMKRLFTGGRDGSDRI